jgi:hypothetical protein
MFNDCPEQTDSGTVITVPQLTVTDNPLSFEVQFFMDRASHIEISAVGIGVPRRLDFRQATSEPILTSLSMFLLEPVS